MSEMKIAEFRESVTEPVRSRTVWRPKALVAGGAALMFVGFGAVVLDQPEQGSVPFRSAPPMTDHLTGQAHPSLSPASSPRVFQRVSRFSVARWTL